MFQARMRGTFLPKFRSLLKVPIPSMLFWVTVRLIFMTDTFVHFYFGLNLFAIF